MKTEFEAKFLEIDKDTLREKLTSIGATCIKPERLMTRVVFENPFLVSNRAWLRIRNEGDKTTMTLKQTTDSTNIDRVKEVEVTVSDFGAAKQLLENAGFEAKRHEDNYRESWRLADIAIEIDTWPQIPTFVEIEGASEDAVQDLAQKLGFEFSEARFGSVDEIYREPYNIDIMSILRLTFEK